MMTPSNPSSSRSTPVRIGWLRVAGSPLSSSAGKARWAVITMSMPACDGGLERRRVDPLPLGRVWVMTGNATWLSVAVSPWPGKCLADGHHAAVLLVPVHLRRRRARRRATGSEENERVPMTGLSGLTLVSQTGAKFVVRPIARSSWPVMAAAVRASFALRPAPRAIDPGNWVAGRADPGDDALLLVDAQGERHPDLRAAGRARPSAGRCERPVICSGSLHAVGPREVDDTAEGVLLHHLGGGRDAVERHVPLRRPSSRRCRRPAGRRAGRPSRAGSSARASR